MKKFIAICAVLLFVAPAFAADWAFYGSQRVGTWYTEKTYPTAVNGQDDDAATQWALQGNSRLGAKVKADKVSGQVELSLSGSDGSDGGVGTRRAYGTWKFTDNAFLKVGKDYSPVTDFISNQWYGGDADLLGNGNFYGRRPAGLTLGVGNFEIAFLTPSYGADLGTTATGINGTTGGDPDSYIPRFEASYMAKLGAGYIKPFAGLQYYTVKDTGLGNVTDDLDVLSYVLGVSTSWNIGAVSLGGQVSYGMNQGAVTGWATGDNPRAASSPYLDGGDDIADVYTLQALFVPALKFTDTLRFEAGFGYRQDNADDAPGYSQKDELWVAYLQAMVTMAPGVYLCPEVGYYDFMDGRNGNSDGQQWYAGAKWQIDF
ncbi:MAG TPA: hypothetical protein VLR50_20620 [Desulfobacterales bacterium]|nr:hypothetical protein [Desulfobacterales bacterium]